MSVSVKHITLWRAEVENKAGVLARTLESLAAAGADLHVVMGYRYPRGEEKAAIEVYPVTTKKSVAAAQAAGLGASSIRRSLLRGTTSRVSHMRLRRQSGTQESIWGSWWRRWLGAATLLLLASRTRRMQTTRLRSLRRPQRLGRSERSSGGKS
jgi:hypothetical protein